MRDVSDDRLMRLGEVIEKVSIGKTHIYAMVKAGSFPAPHKLGPKIALWKLSDIQAWIKRVGEAGG